jgi:hypothetical protein
MRDVEDELEYDADVDSTWAERDEAERAACLAPGVTKIDNRITISY